MVFSSLSENASDWTRLVRLRTFSSSCRSFRSSSTATFLCCIAFTSARNSSDRMERSGRFSPAAANTSITPSVEIAFDTTSSVQTVRAPRARQGET
ncbi:hypothetical protein BE20_19720 [Sorangium cellulosum]|nr:hypothetical protein BE20_19720 [Sorangium cellulosum]